MVGMLPEVQSVDDAVQRQIEGRILGILYLKVSVRSYGSYLCRGRQERSQLEPMRQAMAGELEIAIQSVIVGL